MRVLTCRQCAAEVAAGDAICPACGAPEPSQRDWQGAGRDWRTGATWMGQPLVHIAYGCDAAGRVRVARGVVAIGVRASGWLACGVVATGFFSIGVVSAGVFSLGVVSVALVAALGVNAFAPIACGVVALGAVGGGVEFIGWKTW